MIRESARFALHGSNVSSELNIPSDLLPVSIDRGQMSQVFNNLIINAKQAMPEGGRLIVKAENLTLDEARARAGDEWIGEARHFVAISVRDEGCGIPEHYRRRIFDPYFTTKENGSGLGLATSYSVVKNHNGLLSVESQVGVGTTFHIVLPASPEQAREPGLDSALRHTPGHGHLLVMDDDPSIRGLSAAMLEKIGYRAQTARNGDDALRMYKAAQDQGVPFNAVILDRGAMGGREAASELLRLDPYVCLLASSGYSNDPVMARFADHGFAAILPKPYQLEELERLLARLLPPL